MDDDGSRLTRLSGRLTAYLGVEGDEVGGSAIDPPDRAGPIGPDEFLFRVGANSHDRQRGLTILWLASERAWKQRVTERVSLPRRDTLSTTLEIDIDLKHVGGRDLASDEQDTVWLPLLLMPTSAPSVLDVVDADGTITPRLTAAETRWYLAAALAHLIVRSHETLAANPKIHDVELMWAAVLRRHLARVSKTERSIDREIDSTIDRDEHARYRTARRLVAARETAKKATEEHLRSLAHAASALRPEVSSIGPETSSTRLANYPALPVEILRMIEEVGNTRLLVVAGSLDRPRNSFRCELPSRQLHPGRLRPAATSLDIVRRQLFRIPWLGRSLDEGRDERRNDRLHRSGPLGGRCDVDLDLVGHSSAGNYHVLLDLPNGVAGRNVELRFEWDTAEILTSLVERLDAVFEQSELEEPGRDARLAAGEELAAPERWLATERSVRDLITAAREVIGYLGVLGWSDEADLVARRARPGGDADVAENAGDDRAEAPPRTEAAKRQLELLATCLDRDLQTEARLLVDRLDGMARRYRHDRPISLVELRHAAVAIRSLLTESGVVPATRSSLATNRHSAAAVSTEPTFQPNGSGLSFDIVEPLLRFCDDVEELFSRAALCRELQTFLDGVTNESNRLGDGRDRIDGWLTHARALRASNPWVVVLDRCALHGESSVPVDVTRTYRPRRDPRADQVHIAVAATDRLPPRIALRGARLRAGLYATEPRPHTATNMANLGNIVVTIVVGIILAVTKSPAAVDALVAVLVLVPSVQAARIDRPTRSEVGGWLRAFPHTLAMWSPVPTILFAILVAGLGGTESPSRWTWLVPGITFALVFEVVLLMLGVHSRREASYWEDSDGFGVRPPRPPRRRRVQEAAGKGQPFQPAIRVLGANVRWLSGDRPWLVPLIGVPRQLEPRSERRLLSSSIATEEMLARALPRIGPVAEARSIIVTAKDKRGMVADLLQRVESPGVDVDLPRPPAILAAVGISLGGHFIAQLVVDDPLPRLERATEHGGETVEPVEPVTGPLPEQSTHLDPLVLGYTALRGHRDIMQLFIELPEVVADTDTGPGASPPDTAAFDVLDGIARTARLCSLTLQLVHLPAAPPHVDGAGPRWMRVRVGLAEGQESLVYGFLSTVQRDVAAGRRCLVHSVSELARPDEGPKSSELAVDYRDMSSPPGATKCGFLIVHTPDRLGTLADITAQLDAATQATLIGCSASVALGISMIVLQFRDQVDREIEQRVRTAVAAAIGGDGETDRRAIVHRVNHDARNNEWLEELGDDAVGLRLTWNAPNAPGLLRAVVDEISSQPEHLDSQPPNIYYVMSRVSGGRANIGRVVLRLHHLGHSAEPETSEALVRYVTSIRSSVESRIRRHVVEYGSEASRFRDVFVIAEPFLQKGATAPSPVENATDDLEVGSAP